MNYLIMNIINIKLYHIIPYNEPMIEKVTKVSASHIGYHNEILLLC